ncbi:MAG: formylglycine-generating enzyme family protein [Rhodoferax sp.]|nr:formylglycine-generating enzyme family protein [Rhodoferax sp.]
MNRVNSGIVAVATLAGGYMGYKLTGGWVGVPVGAVVVGYTGFKLLAGEFVSAVIALFLGAVALFYFMVTGTPEISRETLPQSGEGFTKPAIEFDANAPAVAASAAASSIVAEPTVVAQTQNGNVVKDCADCPELVTIPAGSFSMGSSAGTPFADASESPSHVVTVSSFAMGQDAVTRGQFSVFVTAANYQSDAERLGGCFGLAGDNWEFKPKLTWRRPGYAQDDSHPVVCVTWNDANAYLQWLSAATKKKYRLPTEAEREYATRAGSTEAYWWGNSINLEQANYRDDALFAKDPSKRPSRMATVPVKQFAANPFGLYNVHGNVWEWVQDCQHNSYGGAPADGTAWANNCAGKRRGARGGGWTNPAVGLRSAQRTWFEPDLPSYAGGFRVVRE